MSVITDRVVQLSYCFMGQHGFHVINQLSRIFGVNKKGSSGKTENYTDIRWNIDNGIYENTFFFVQQWNYNRH